MQVSVSHKNFPSSPQKIRTTLGQLKGMSVMDAQYAMQFAVTKAAKLGVKLLKAMAANIENNHSEDVSNFKLQAVMINDGVRARRFKARAKGRGTRVLKRMCNVVLIASN